MMPHSVLRATYLMLLSLCNKNLPRILMARWRSPSSASMAMMVCTHSYRIAFPGFFDGSVLIDTCARISLICSLAFELPLPSKRISSISLHCKNGSVIPTTSNSETYPASRRFFKWRTSCGTNFRNLVETRLRIVSISMISEIPQMRTQCCLVPRRDVAGSTKSEIISGTLRMIRIAQRAAFFLMYGFPLRNRRITSLDRSLAISAEEIFPIEHKASPTMYGFLCFKSFLRQFVTSIRTSCVSSKRSISPK
mmetsp:Transcript_35560/g.57386  ORF Transcript_35560/g.57386 Transcript_35560/m.57386 type:complete len:251 (-) Transcript_35560:307-1059(-)